MDNLERASVSNTPSARKNFSVIGTGKKGLLPLFSCPDFGVVEAITDMEV
jgi:hypothetical protein